MKLRAVLLALMILPGAAFAWWNDAFSERKPIAIDTGPAGLNLTAPVAESNILLRLHGGNFPAFLSSREGGADLRLVAGDDATPLDFAIERFDPVAQIALIWVKVPGLNPAPNEDKFYLYYGNPEALAANTASPFSADTAGVFHFDDPSGAVTDSSGRGTALQSGQLFPNPASLIGIGGTLPGTEPLVFADAGQMTMSAEQGMSLAMWVRFNEAPAAEAVVFERPGTAQGLRVSVNGGTLEARYGDAAVPSTAPVNAGVWHHVGISLGPQGLALYLDGQNVGSAPVTPELNANPLYIGGGANGGALATMDIDELRVLTTAQPDAWFRIAHAVQGERNDAVITYGAGETAEGGGHGAEGGHGGAGHFATIWYSVFGPGGPMVERVVITICGLMMVIAIGVIFFKTISLARARSATTRFEKAYAKLAIGATDPDQGFGAIAGKNKRFGASPLFRVYQVAVEQVATRQGSPAVGAAATGLDGKTIKTIQAKMDSTMVRQSQGLNSAMVLLTIAISGGPFIGLLGTVVGVMTTFGAIAATGDINITAIAPGMAAALLATVAGLGVAIPALFGYNYLGAQVKALSADMSVFADELTARITEEFGA